MDSLEDKLRSVGKAICVEELGGEKFPAHLRAVVGAAERIAELEAAARKAQKAIAACLGAGGVIDDGDDTEWWLAIISAQQGLAAALSKR